MRQPKHNSDRVIKRFLPWILLTAIAGILISLYYPDPESLLPPEPAHDTASETQSLTSTEADEPEAALPQITDTPPEESPVAPKILLAPDAENAQTKADDSAPNALEEKKAKSRFEKKLLRIGATNNAWQALNNRKLNPALLKQLSPLKKRLSTRYDSLDILYSDYLVNNTIQPINSKILAVRSNKWSLFSREKNGVVSYYDINGAAPEFTMDRVPFAYSKITSPFNLHRVHPVTRRVRPHLGVDLKGPYGNPIAATGNGIVIFAGWQSGYGRLVIIDHGNDYETRYGHLSAISVKTGERVKRGQIIGKLGNSGISTGAHLHYEVRIDGTPYDPMRVKLPTHQPLPKSELPLWQTYSKEYLATIEALKTAAQAEK